MKRATLEKVQSRLGEYVEASAKQPVVIVRNGKPVAMLVGLNHGAKPPVKLRDVLKRAWRDYKKHGGIPHDRFWKELAEEAKSS